VDNDDKEGVTVTAAISAAGEKLPLTVIGNLGRAFRIWLDNVRCHMPLFGTTKVASFPLPITKLTCLIRIMTYK
jgi:hypothetical protein